MKKRVILFGLAIAVISILIIYLLIDKEKPMSTTIKKQPLQNEAEYTETFNQAINRAEEDHKKYLEYAETAEGKKASESYWNKMLFVAKGRSKDIKFHGSVVDQQGNPVADATVHFVAISGHLAKGSGHQQVRSDERGVFRIDGVVGTGLSVDRIIKSGYEVRISQSDFDNFPRFDDSVLWSNYTKDNPYVFKAWKVAESGYPKVSKAQGRYGFKPGTTYSLDFTATHKSRVIKEGELDLDLQVLFEKDTDERWTLAIKVPNGGLLETEDTYMNLAPEMGYRQELTFSGTLQEYEKNRQSVRATRKYYIHSRGRLYGSLEIGIRPYSKPSGSGLKINHVMNLDGGRNLEAK